MLSCYDKIRRMITGGFLFSFLQGRYTAPYTEPGIVKDNTRFRLKGEYRKYPYVCIILMNTLGNHGKSCRVCPKEGGKYQLSLRR